MKYERKDLNDLIIGEGFIVYDWTESADRIDIYVKSDIKTQVCPECHEETSDLHSTYVRVIQTVPLKGKATYLHVIAYKFNCNNDRCSTKVIVQSLPFASWKQRRTVELDALILAVSCFLSDEGASKVFECIGIRISNDSIRRLRQKLEFIDNPDIEMVGIDDVAIRKGQSYATAIYDMEDHHMIALLDGRNAETLKKWLYKHNKIRVVARDRASAYASAINEVLPECIQIADRFHMLQNLMDRMKDIFKAQLPEKIYIEDGKILDETPKKQKILKAPLDSPVLDTLDYDGTAPLDNDGNPVIFNNKSTPQSGKQEKQQAERRKKNRN